MEVINCPGVKGDEGQLEMIQLELVLSVSGGGGRGRGGGGGSSTLSSVIFS